MGCHHFVLPRTIDGKVKHHVQAMGLLVQQISQEHDALLQRFIYLLKIDKRPSPANINQQLTYTGAYRTVFNRLFKSDVHVAYIHVL